MVRKISILVILAAILLPGLLDGQHLGIGVIIGSPTGFNLKYSPVQRSAISASLGWALGDHPGFHGTCDYQFLFPTTLRWRDDFEGTTTEIKNLVPYLGIGGRVKFKENVDGDMEMNVGARMGGGVEYLFSYFGIFLEIYPVVNILPETDFDMEGGLGFRFYLK
jgi:hypothetical protein